MAKENQNRSEQNFDFFFLYIYSLEKSEELWVLHKIYAPRLQCEQSIAIL